MRAHVIADREDPDGGYVTERLAGRGFDLVEVDRAALPAFAEVGESDLVLLLGSDRSAHDPKQARVVDAESRFVLSALGDGVPVIGICYGAQLMARAFGGTSWRADEPELGWQRVDTIDPVLCPEGPWGQMHKDVFAPGPTSRVIGTSWRGPQAILDDSFGARSVAWQFHPEVTPQTYERWVRAGYFGDVGVDAEDLVRQAYDHAPTSRNLAFRLVDDALTYLGLG